MNLNPKIILNDARLNLLIGSGASRPHFETLNNIENAFALIDHNEESANVDLARVLCAKRYVDAVVSPELEIGPVEGSQTGDRAKETIAGYARLISANESDWRPVLKAYLDIPGFSISCDTGKLRILGAAIVLCYYDEATKSYSNTEHLVPLIKRLNSRIGDLEKVVSPSTDKLMPKTLTIVSLRDVNIEMRK